MDEIDGVVKEVHLTVKALKPVVVEFSKKSDTKVEIGICFRDLRAEMVVGEYLDFGFEQWKDVLERKSCCVY